MRTPDQTIPRLWWTLGGAAALVGLPLGCTGDPDPDGQTDTPTEAAGTVAETPTYTAAPTAAPTVAPTDAPTAVPTDAPTEAPTDAPTDPPTDPPPTETAGAGTQPPGGPVAERPSRSSTIALSSDDAYVVMVNNLNDSVSVFATADSSLRSRVSVGREPSAVVVHPDDTTFFVANQADATVSRLTGLTTVNPQVTDTVDVGSEPTGLALSPTGRWLFVAEWAEGSVSVIDTRTMEVETVLTGLGRPRAVSVTNDGDGDDDDETLVVPDFYGAPIRGAEAKDVSRVGQVHTFSLDGFASGPTIPLSALDSGFVPDGSPQGTATVMTSPNQLWAAAIQGDRVYLPSVSASPAAPVKFNTNVQPVVYVLDLGDGAEVKGEAQGGTTNLARKVADELPKGQTRFFLADIVDMDFKGLSGGIAYVASRGADVVQRVVYGAGSVDIGSDNNVQIDLLAPVESVPGCQAPSGIVTALRGSRAYVNCWANRRLGVVDLSIQRLSTTVESALAPGTAESNAVDRGRRFFFTGRTRWSSEAWSGCGSCHPAGLTDNITWSFAAGPRQTTSTDGSFSKAPGEQVQRILNWTGIFDELHDFERNTRGVSGGLGAVTQAGEGSSCGDVTTEVPLGLQDGLQQPVKEVQDTGCTDDWDEVEAWVKTIRPPKGLQRLDEASVARGAALFGESTAQADNGGCVFCHGGVGWTASRRFYTPSSETNAALAEEAFVRPALWPASWNAHTTQIEVQPASTSASGSAQGPLQVSCALRDIGTFGIPGDDDATDALEVRATGTLAQGEGGYNIPSLLGVSMGAPYLHHGQAASLEDLFDDAEWSSHLRAGNQVFLTSGDAAQQKRDLINYLRSIDADTAIRDLPAGYDGCPED